MTCQEIQLLINDHFEEGGDDDRQQIVFGHISGCRDCRIFFDSIFRTKSAALRERISYPEELDDELLPLLNPSSGRMTGRGNGNIIRSLIHPRRADAALSYPVAIMLALLMFGLGLVLKGKFSPAPTRQTIPAVAAIQPGSVMIIYGLPPVEVAGLPARDIIQHQQ